MECFEIMEKWQRKTAFCQRTNSLFGWLVADGWCWFVLREEYCWLVAGGWFVVREKYCWLVADKPSEQGEKSYPTILVLTLQVLGNSAFSMPLHFGEELKMDNWIPKLLLQCHQPKPLHSATKTYS
jgi:hypothetical protein